MIGGWKPCRAQAVVTLAPTSRKLNKAFGPTAAQRVNTHMSKQDDDYDDEFEALQGALVRFQQAAIASGQNVLVIFEGRDAAGKDGAIKRITEHLSVRNTRVVALPKPTDRERTQWYFQRYAEHLPAAGELVIFNRSWYNRGGVEPVMGFCTPDEHESFLRDVSGFEAMLVGSGIQIIKLCGQSHLHGFCAELAEDFFMFDKCALQRENANPSH